MIVKIMQGYFARKRVKEYRDMIIKIKKIQKFYRKRFRNKIKSSVKIQKYLKGLK